jgi:hypothetical protein
MTLLRAALIIGLLAFSTAPVIKAQDPASQPAAADAQTDEQKQKQQEELENKANALLDQIIGQVQLLKLPENRIRVQTAAGDLLWKRNPDRARAMFSLAADGVAELMRSTDTRLQRGVGQLRQEVVLTAAQHDAVLAYQLLAATRPLTTAPDSGNDFRGRGPDNSLEDNLLARVAAIDPKLAADKVSEALAKGQYPNTLAQVLVGLDSQDKEAARKLTAKVVGKLQSENLLANTQAGSLTWSLLQTGVRPATDATPVAGVEPAVANQPTASSRPANVTNTPLLDEASFQSLLNLVIDAALKATPQAMNSRGGNIQRGRGGFGGAQNAVQGQLTDGQLEQQYARRLLAGLQGLLPQIDQYAPSRSTAVRNKMTELGITDNPRQAFNQMNTLMQQGTVDSILAAAPTVPPQLQSRLYQQAAQRALDEGNMDRARQIANEHLEATARDRVLQQIDFQMLTKKVAADNLEELRQTLGTLRSDDERIELLLQLAAQAQWAVGPQQPAMAAPADPKLALKFLGEAQRLTNRRATNYQQLEQQLRVADAFASLDPSRSFEVVDPGIAQLNELLSAAALLSGFEVDIFKDGELVLGGNSRLGEMVSRYGQELARLAKTDFARAESSTNKFQLPEPRLFSQLTIVRNVLGVPQAAAVNNGFRGGFGRRTR